MARQLPSRWLGAGESSTHLCVSAKPTADGSVDRALEDEGSSGAAAAWMDTNDWVTVGEDTFPISSGDEQLVEVVAAAARRSLRRGPRGPPRLRPDAQFSTCFRTGHRVSVQLHPLPSSVIAGECWGVLAPLSLRGGPD